MQPSPESRTNRTASIRPKDTNAWIAQVWISWAVAMACMGFGIYHLPVSGWQRGFLGMGTIYTVGSTFTLAKTIRDQQEATQGAK